MRLDFSRIAVIVPAAGAGRRFGEDQPKQYARIAGRPLLDYTLEVLRACQPADFVLVTAAEDGCWRDVPATAEVRVVTGGASRAASVAAGISALGDTDWVLVHDAARPCVRAEDIHRLVAGVDPRAGGLLAIPMTDTVKRSTGSVADLADCTVDGTVDRVHLWRAQTPQLFPRETLARALRANPEATDEAGAIEALGLAPALIEGDPDNLKVTVAGDLARCEDVLRRQGRLVAGAASGAKRPNDQGADT